MTTVDKFFATLGLGGRPLEKVMIRKGKRWGLMVKFTQNKGFFIGNYIPFFMKPFADKAQIKKYAKSLNEILFVDRKSYEQYQVMYKAQEEPEEPDKTSREGHQVIRQERTEVYQRTKLPPYLISSEDGLFTSEKGISLKDINEALRRLEEDGGL